MIWPPTTLLALFLATPIFTLHHIYPEPLSFSKPAVLCYHSTILVLLSLPLFLYQTEMEQYAFFLLMKGLFRIKIATLSKQIELLVNRKINPGHFETLTCLN